MADLAPGSTFADYRIEGLIAQGGMGVVYRAVHPKLERTVALKLIRPPLAENEEFRQRFMRESKVAASLDHPNVVPIHDADEHDGVPFLVMRYVDGHDLRTLVREHGRLAPERAARIVVQVASALDAAHAAGLVHRDVKPANVLLTGGDHVYLTDFGLSKRLAPGEEETRTGTMLGTLNWIAPEQIRREPVGAHTDVYALGCVLFHLLTAQVPFPGETEWEKLSAHLSETVPAPSAVCPDVPQAFDLVVARAMAKRPEDRWRSAGDLGCAAATAAAAPSASAAAAPTDAPPARGAPARASAPTAPQTQAAARTPVSPRALLPRALADPFALALLVTMPLAGLLIGQLLVLTAVALLLYAAAVARACLDEDVRQGVAERASGPPRPAPQLPAVAPAPVERGASIDEMVDQAVEQKARIQEAIAAADFSLPDVSRELDEFESTIRRTAEGAQLVQAGLGEASSEAVARRIREVEPNADNEQLLATLRREFDVRRRMEGQMERFREEMMGMLLELDSLRAELSSASDSTAVGREEQLAAELRGLRVEIGGVADGLADAAREERGLDPLR